MIVGIRKATYLKRPSDPRNIFLVFYSKYSESYEIVVCARDCKNLSLDGKEVDSYLISFPGSGFV